MDINGAWKTSGITVPKVIFIMLASAWYLPVSAENCTTVASLESFQGSVERRKADGHEWLESRRTDTFCQGDALRTGRKSRATIRMINDTLVRMSQDTVLTFTAIHTEKKSLLELLQGVIHMMSRTPRPLEVQTPFVNAAIEGTEFVITAGLDRSDITVYEGQVRGRSGNDELLLKPNQQGRFAKGAKPQRILTATPRDAVAWTLFYPPLLDPQTIDVNKYAEPKILHQALKHAEAAEYIMGLDLLEKIPGKHRDSGYHLIAASMNLSLGDITASQHHLQAAKQDRPRCNYVSAIEAIISLTQNDLDLAEKKITEALTASSDNTAAWVADSYVKQARFKIPESFAAIEKAVALSPNSARLRARLAELQLMSDHHHQSRESANLAVSLNPRVSLNQTILGFASLHSLYAAGAISAFTEAIALQSGDPLPWLGLGLAQIRQNKLALGRESIETAAMLSPSNALLRSYLGKAYFEEYRNAKADKQFELAKALDPKDPTAWFYHSIQKQTQNQPVAAMMDQMAAIERNDYRGVYRSRQLLDQDEAARTVSLGRIYNDLNFEPLSASQATNALFTDFGNHSAHRLLADSYRGQSSNDSARLSELLQAKMLQPLNLMPLQPQLGDSRLGLLDTAGPGNLSYNEYNPMFTRQGLYTQMEGFADNNGGWGNDAVIAGFNYRTAFSLGQYHYETDGSGINKNFEKDIYHLFAQGRPTEHTMLQFEVKREKETKGDVALKFFPTEFNDPDIQIEREITSFRVGLTHEVSPQSKLLFSAGWKDRNSDSVDPDSFQLNPSTSTPVNVNITNNTDIGLFDFQHLYSTEKHSLISGISRNQEKGINTVQFDFPTIPCPFPNCSLPTSDPDGSQTRAYSYLNYKLKPALNLTTGITVVKQNSPQPELDDQHWLPKFGVNWKINNQLRIKAAAFRTQQANITASHYQTLEPTQIVGFNQLFDEPNHSNVWNYALRFEGSAGGKISWGVSSIYRNGEVPTSLRDFSQTNSSSQIQRIEFNRNLTNLYVNWIINSSLVASAGYSRNKFALSQSFSSHEAVSNFAPDGIEKLNTQRLPLMLQYFHPSGVGLETTITYFDQKGDFILNQADSVAKHGTDRFWLTNISASYRLPKRRGQFSVGIQNVFDQQFQFEDTASNDAFAPLRTAAPSTLNSERLLFGKFSLNFR